MYGNQMESQNLAQVGESEKNFSYEFQHQIDILPSWTIEFPMTPQTDSTVLFCQSHEQSLHSVAESFVSTTEQDIAFSSSANDRNFGSGEHFPQGYKSVLETDGDPDKRSLGISFQRNYQCTKLNKQCSLCEVANSVHRRKRRIRWTRHLHETFIMVVNRLGGPEKAKPKAILKKMGLDVLTISHVKSHLQKYRSTLHMRKALQEISDEGEGHRTNGITELQLKIQMQIEESLQLQLEVQRSIHQQLEMQRNMQLLIEQQRKQLNLMLLDHKNQRTMLKKIHD